MELAENKPYLEFQHELIPTVKEADFARNVVVRNDDGSKKANGIAFV